MNPAANLDRNVARELTRSRIIKPGSRKDVENGWELQPVSIGLGALKDDWDRLNRVLYGGHPFGDSRFVDTILK